MKIKGRKEAPNETADQKQQRNYTETERATLKYIDQVLCELSKKEKQYKNTAHIWYIIGFLSLLSGVVIAIHFTRIGLLEASIYQNWSNAVIISVKNTILIAILISASKYSLNLGNPYRIESYKIADRIHAISYGKLCLKSSRQQVKLEEIIEIFSDWNISSSSISIEQKSNNQDSRITDKAIEILDKISDFN